MKRKLIGFMALGGLVLLAVAAAAKVGTPVVVFDGGNTGPMTPREDVVRGMVYGAGRSTSLDLRGTGNVITLFTQGGNTDFVPLSIVIRVKSASNVTAPAEISIGTNGDADNILPVTVMTELDSAGEAHVISDIMTTAVVTNGTACKIKITTGATATILDADVMILGTAL